MCSDPYEEYRDELGRFIEGNPGRQKGTYEWLSHKEFNKKYDFLLVKMPDICPDCGFNEYRFNIRWDNNKTYLLCARCNRCNQRRWYSPFNETWT